MRNNANGGMPADVARDMSVAARAFQELAWPAIAPYIGGGQYVSLENDDEPLHELLDQTAGFDGLQMINGLVRGLAIRMQPDTRRWDTFTVRYLRQSGATTEFEKRNAAVTGKWAGWLRPFYTIQGYYDENTWRLLSVAAVPSDDLILYMARELHGMQRERKRVFFRKNYSDGKETQFLYTYWQDLIDDGLPVYVAPIELRETLNKPPKEPRIGKPNPRLPGA